MFVPDHYDFLSPAKFISGLNALNTLPVELQALGSQRPLILSTAAEAQAGSIQKLIRSFKDSGMTFGVFDAVDPAPDRETVSKLAGLYQDRAHDAVVVVGTGSIVDVGKGVCLAAGHPDGALNRATDENGAPLAIKPLVLVMTGPGDGREASCFFSLDGTNLTDHELMPDLIAIDPKIVRVDNGKMAAEGAMTTLTHAMEASVAAGQNPLVDTYALAAVGLVVAHLRSVINKPGLAKSVSALTNASAMAAVALANAPAGPARGLGTAAAGVNGISPAVAMGLILPYSLAYFAQKNRSAVGELLLPLAGFDRYSDTSEKRRAEAAIERVFEIQRWMTPAGIAGPLNQSSLTKNDLPAIVDRVFDPDSGLDRESLAEILSNAFDGGPAAVDE
jgi:alcohol dehydrogenase